jgi:hypothetical protein
VILYELVYPTFTASESGEIFNSMKEEKTPPQDWDERLVNIPKKQNMFELILKMTSDNQYERPALDKGQK